MAFMHGEARPAARRSHPTQARFGARATWHRWALLALGWTTLNAAAGTVYLCKSYSGGQFWSTTHCNRQQALIERIVSVPDGMPFHQQVELGTRAHQQAQQLTAPPSPSTTVTETWTQSGASSLRGGECAALASQIQQHEAMARQPQTGQMQDWIATQKRTARDRQFQLRCP